jgi:hypothetical protein
VDLADLLKSHFKMLVACAVLAGVLWLLGPQLHVVWTCMVGGMAYLGVAVLLKLPEVYKLLPQPKGLPPFLDNASQSGLRALAQGALVVEGTTFYCASGIWQLVARKGILFLEPAHGAGEAGPEGGPVAIIVRIGQGPPAMKGLEIGNRVWFADGDEVKEGPCPGPRIPVSPP